MMKHDYDTASSPRSTPAAKRRRLARHRGARWRSEPSYRFYSALRYNAQEMCYLSVQPAVERALPGDDRPGAQGRRSTQPGRRLAAPHPALEVPRYVAALDVHLAPGSFIAEYTADDVAQGAVVAFGGKVFTGQHPYRKRRRRRRRIDRPLAAAQAPGLRSRGACSTSAPPAARTCCPTRPLPAARAPWHRRRCAGAALRPCARRGTTASPCTSASRMPNRPTFPTAIST